MKTVPLSLICHPYHQAKGRWIAIERATIEPKMMKAVLEFIFFKWQTAKYRSNPIKGSCLFLKPELKPIQYTYCQNSLTILSSSVCKSR